VRGLPHEAASKRVRVTPPLTDDQRARVEANLGLIQLVLTKRATPTQDWDDAWQDGIFGLARAAQKYDPSLGYTFGTYAVTWIRQSVQVGKGRREGSAFRRSRLGNGGSGVWDPPVSLDAPRSDDGWSLSELLAADDDPAADAATTADSAAMVRAALGLCTDDVDRAIVAAWAEGRPPHTALPDLPRHTVADRVGRLRARLRHPSHGLRVAA
jgi:hypothetical protein